MKFFPLNRSLKKHPFKEKRKKEGGVDPTTHRKTSIRFAFREVTYFYCFVML